MKKNHSLMPLQRRIISMMLVGVPVADYRSWSPMTAGEPIFPGGMPGEAFQAMCVL